MSARKHGHSNTRLYNTWRGMIGRCKHSTNRHYERYGGRGISVCDAWHDASTFIAWALANGWESGLEIDRIDNDGDYCPDNCRFVTSKENSRNTRRNVFITYLGETMCISAWADRTGLHKKTIETRLGRYGWTVEQTLTLPLQKGKRP